MTFFRQPSTVWQVWCFWGISDWTVSRTWCCGVLNSWSNSSRVVNFCVLVIVTRSVLSWVPSILNRNCNQKILSETSTSSGPTSEVEFPINIQMWQMPSRTFSAHISKWCEMYNTNCCGKYAKPPAVLLYHHYHTCTRCDQARQRKVYSKSRRCSVYVEHDCICQNETRVWKYAVSHHTFTNMI